MKACPHCSADMPDAVDWCPSCKRSTQPTAVPARRGRIGFEPFDFFVAALGFGMVSVLLFVLDLQVAFTVVVAISSFLGTAAAVGLGVDAGMNRHQRR